MKNHSRGTYQNWCAKIVTAVQSKCKSHTKDVISCINHQTETTIDLDMSLQPTTSPIIDADRNITAWTAINPIEQDEFNRETRKYDARVLAYESNKQIACSIVMDSIKPYYIEKLEKHSDLDAKKYELVWLLRTIKSFCSYDTEEQNLTLVCH